MSEYQLLEPVDEDRFPAAHQFQDGGLASSSTSLGIRA